MADSGHLEASSTLSNVSNQQDRTDSEGVRSEEGRRQEWDGKERRALRSFLLRFTLY